METELQYAALTAVFTGLLWIPLILNRLGEMGVWKALRNPEPDIRPRAAWAYRLANAHRNAIENLVVFAPLAVAVTITDTGTAATAAWSAAFFFTRVAHAVIYTLGVPLLRTIAFFIGFVAQMILAVHLFGLV